MEKCTLVFPRHGDIVYLGIKKRKEGANLYNGWGGKFNPGEGDKSILDTAVREFGQETKGFYPNPRSLDLVAIIRFFMAGEPIFECYVYFLNLRKGEQDRLLDSEEMGEGLPFDKNNLPVSKMMPADTLFLKRLIEGERLQGDIYYSDGNKEVLDFKFEPLQESALLALSA